ncbi:hypothetical protein [Sphingomonas sp.]|uniref:hypothetical protein n=1 Tax=Sphingomonas sp. TaxID=28214 RepID=UPI003F7252BA
MQDKLVVVCPLCGGTNWTTRLIPGNPLAPVQIECDDCGRDGKDLLAVRFTALASPPLQPLLNAKSPPPSNRVNMVLPAPAASPPVDGGEWRPNVMHESESVGFWTSTERASDGGEFVMVPREPTEASEMLDRIEATMDTAERIMSASPFWDENSRYAGKALLDYPRSQIAAERKALAASPSRPSPPPEQREVVEAMRQAAIVVFQSEARKLAGSEAEFIAATESFIRGVDEAKAALCDPGE